LSIPVEETVEEKPVEAAKPPPPPEPVSQETFHHTPHVPDLDRLAESEPEKQQEQPLRTEKADSLPIQIPEVVEQKAGYEPERPEPAHPVPQPEPAIQSTYVQKPPEPSPVQPSPEPKVKPKPPPPPPTPEEQLQRAFNVSGVWQWLEGQLTKSEKAPYP